MLLNPLEFVFVAGPARKGLQTGTNIADFREVFIAFVSSPFHLLQLVDSRVKCLLGWFREIHRSLLLPQSFNFTEKQLSRVIFFKNYCFAGRIKFSIGRNGLWIFFLGNSILRRTFFELANKGRFSFRFRQNSFLFQFSHFARRFLGRVQLGQVFVWIWFLSCFWEVCFAFWSNCTGCWNSLTLHKGRRWLVEVKIWWFLEWWINVLFVFLTEIELIHELRVLLISLLNWVFFRFNAQFFHALIQNS